MTTIEAPLPVTLPEEKEEEEHDDRMCHVLRPAGNELFCGRDPSGKMYVMKEDTSSDRGGHCGYCGNIRCPQCMEWL